MTTTYDNAYFATAQAEAIAAFKADGKEAAAPLINDILEAAKAVAAPDPRKFDTEIVSLFASNPAGTEHDVLNFPLGVIAVPVMRNILAINHVTFDPNNVPNWRWFADTYQATILQA
jgi:hypothetical protein